MSNRICNDHAPVPHNEAICHATGEKRQNIINKLKMFLDQVDDRPCLINDDRQISKRKPMMKFPGYVDYSHPAFRQEVVDCLKPTPQKIPITENTNCNNGEYFQQVDKESNDYSMKMEVKQHVDYKDKELRGGEFLKTCYCLKANGVQDQCPLSDCQGKEECMAVNPGPCCKPALTRLCEEKREKLQKAEIENMKNEEKYMPLKYEEKPAPYKYPENKNVPDNCQEFRIVQYECHN